MNILVTVDTNYMQPLRVMLKSMFLNNPYEKFDIYLLHAGIKKAALDDMDVFIRYHGSRFIPIPVAGHLFDDAPVLFHYTKEMYFRLLAFRLLPADLDRILYLDPDILILNPIRKLYETEIDGYLYAAAYHKKFSVKEINKIRLFPYEIDAYYNSGVLLMNLKQMRREVDEREIYRFIEANRAKLVMPDQDIINALYAKKIKKLDELYYNYDTRYFSRYKLTSGGCFDMGRVINETVVLHFCGKKKPWQENYTGKFLSLYKHYEKQAGAAIPLRHAEKEKTGCAQE